MTLELYFAQNRFYDAENHRFTQEDPIKDGDNWYGYVGNGPLGAVDPFGLLQVDIGGKMINTITTVPEQRPSGYGYATIRDAISLYAGPLEQQKDGTFVARTPMEGNKRIKFVFDDKTGSLSVIQVNGNQEKTNTIMYRGDYPGKDERVKGIIYVPYKLYKDESNSTNYVDISYFVKLMCELGYKKNIKIIEAPTVYANNTQVGASNKLTQEQQEANALYMYQYLHGKGWTMEAVAGLFGNFNEESYFNPGAWQSANKDPYNNKIGYGLMQSTPANNFLDWAQWDVATVEKMAVNDPQTLIDKQLDYIIWASSPSTPSDKRAWWKSLAGSYTPYYMSFEEFIKAGPKYNPGDLAVVFEAHFERSGDDLKQRQERYDAANVWYKFLQDNTK